MSEGKRSLRIGLGSTIKVPVKMTVNYADKVSAAKAFSQKTELCLPTYFRRTDLTPLKILWVMKRTGLGKEKMQRKHSVSSFGEPFQR